MPVITRIGQPRAGKHVLVSLARINSQALSVKPGNSAQDRQVPRCKQASDETRH